MNINLKKEEYFKQENVKISIELDNYNLKKRRFYRRLYKLSS